MLSDLTDTNGLRRKAMRQVFRDLGRPRRPATIREAGALAYVTASIVYVFAMSVIAVAGVPTLLRTLLPSAIDTETSATIALAAGLILAVTLVGPFVHEAIEARRQPLTGVV